LKGAEKRGLKGNSIDDREMLLGAAIDWGKDPKMISFPLFFSTLRILMNIGSIFFTRACSSFRWLLPDFGLV
jgi:hypothetical protein